MRGECIDFREINNNSKITVHLQIIRKYIEKLFEGWNKQKVRNE